MATAEDFPVGTQVVLHNVGTQVVLHNDYYPSGEVVCNTLRNGGGSKVVVEWEYGEATTVAVSDLIKATDLNDEFSVLCRTVHSKLGAAVQLLKEAHDLAEAQDQRVRDLKADKLLLELDEAVKEVAWSRSSIHCGWQ